MSNNGKSRILVVEADEILAVDIERRLERLGYVVAGIVSSGAEAVKAVERSCCDLILMDIEPEGGVEGIEAAGAGDGLNIPIVYVTAQTDGQTQAADPHRHITKPFDDKDLYLAIEMAVYKHTAGRELRASKEFAENLIDAANAIIVVLDPDGKIMTFNKFSETLTGYARDDVLGQNWFETFVPQVDRDGVRHVHEGVLAGGSDTSSHENVIITKAGETRLISWNNRRLENDKGEPIGAIAVGIDVTEQRKVQKTTRESEIRYRELFNNMSSGVAVYRPVEDGTDFVFEDLNRAGERMDKAGKGDVVGRKVTEMFPGVEKFGLLDVFRRVNRTGEPQHHPVSLYEDNKLSAWFDNYVYRLPSGEIVAVHDDVTEQKVAYRKLEAQQYYLAKAQEMGGIGTWELDLAKNRLVWTEQNYRIFGLPVGTELTYETFLSRVHPEDREYVHSKWTAALNHEPYDIEHRLVVDGQLKWVREKAEVRFAEDGRPVLAIGFTQDITERKKMEEEIERESRLRSTLLDHLPCIAMVLRKGTRRIVASNRIAAGLGAVPGRTCYGTCTDRDMPCPFCLAPEVWSSNESRRLEVEYGGKHYEGIWVPLTEDLYVHYVFDITERKRAERRILADREQLKSLASQLSRIEERERHRLATALHDQIGQSLVFSKLKLDELRTCDSCGELAGALSEVCSRLGKVIQETRTLTFDLSYPILYELGFEAAVAEWLTDEIRDKHGIETEFDDDGRQKPLSDDIRAILFRNVRELLVNVVKHARASKVRVSIGGTDRDISVSVEDDGVGFDPAEVRAMAARGDRFGLFSVRERLEQLGGLIEIDSGPGRGSRILMKAPLKCERLMDGEKL